MTTLKNVLLLNGVSSGATALLLVLFPSAIATIFGTTSTLPFIGAGIFLLIFAAFVLNESRQNPLRTGMIKIILVLDILWVIDSLALVVFQLFDLSFWGYLLIGGVALWVAVMAFLQQKGLKSIPVA
jgi:hypothetical protein